MAGPLIEFFAEVETAAPPESVWSVMADTRREPEWMRVVQHVEFTDGSGAYRPGARMRRAGRFLGMTLSWSSEVVRCEPNRLIAFTHTGGALAGESQWEIMPAVTGSRIRFSSKGPAHGFLAWLPAAARMAGRLGLRGDLARLRRLAEQELPHPAR